MGKAKSGSKDKYGDGRKVVARNKTARYKYDIEDVYEAGVALAGTEVKSLRGGQADLRDSYADIRNGEVFLENCHIAPYFFGNRANHITMRSRKLLLHRSEIKKLVVRVNEKGFTLVPLEIYFKNGKAKIAVGVAKGKKTYDRREDIRKKDVARDMEREQSNYKKSY